MNWTARIVRIFPQIVRTTTEVAFSALLTWVLFLAVQALALELITQGF